MNTYQKVKRYLDERGIKYRVVELKAGLAEGSLSRTMAGKRKLQADEFLNICIALGVSPENFC